MIDVFRITFYKMVTESLSKPIKIDTAGKAQVEKSKFGWQIDRFAHHLGPSGSLDHIHVPGCVALICIPLAPVKGMGRYAKAEDRFEMPVFFIMPRLVSVT